MFLKIRVPLALPVQEHVPREKQDLRQRLALACAGLIGLEDQRSTRATSLSQKYTLAKPVAPKTIPLKTRSNDLLIRRIISF